MAIRGNKKLLLAVAYLEFGAITLSPLIRLIAIVPVVSAAAVLRVVAAEAEALGLRPKGATRFGRAPATQPAGPLSMTIINGDYYAREPVGAAFKTPAAPVALG